MILNQGLDGSSLVVQGGPGNDNIRIALSGGGWTIADGGPIYAGGGCANPPATHVVFCLGDAAPGPDRRDRRRR